MIWGHCIVIRYITVDINSLLNLYEQGAGEVFLQLADMHHI